MPIFETFINLLVFLDAISHPKLHPGFGPVSIELRQARAFASGVFIYYWQ
jgi:hypothetical protein